MRASDLLVLAMLGLLSLVVVAVLTLYDCTLSSGRKSGLPCDLPDWRNVVMMHGSAIGALAVAAWAAWMLLTGRM